jgi:hypothetical protein
MPSLRDIPRAFLAMHLELYANAAHIVHTAHRCEAGEGLVVYWMRSDDFERLKEIVEAIEEHAEEADRQSEE